LEEIVMGERLIVIGGVAAGMSAAAKAKRTRREMEVMVCERGSFISYAACGMPYYLAGEVTDHRELIVRTPEQMIKQGIDVRVRHEVTAIDVASGTVAVRDHDRERDITLHYDKLVIATGARAACPPLEGCGLNGVFGLRSLQSGLDIHGFLSEHRPKKAVILGGGYIGVEMAETFRRLGLETTVIIRSGKVLRETTDEDIRKLVTAELDRHGVALVHDLPISFEGDTKLSAVVTAGGRHPCEIALVGVGAEPNAELAHAAGIDIGPTGAIATDASMRTNLPGVYAAGDCAEAQHLVTGKPAYIPLGSTANKQGRVAGENAAGGKALFGGIVGTMVVRCFDLAVASTGLTATAAREAGFEVDETTIQAKDISHYFPGAEDIHVKLVAEAGTGRLLGGQIAGKRHVAKRIDVLATALYNRMTVAQLSQLDLSYAPPFAPVWDPILVAANVANK
jgi:NADPH-dependent 2,4-dienoyl-CoA reductase/sulfur reductase-like enzyme